MILFFSGTGNSRYVAERIAASLNDNIADLSGRIKNKDYSLIFSETPFVIVCPTYAWRIPRILSEYIEKTELSGSEEIYFVMTCGDSIGNADAYCKKLCKAKKMKYMGCEKIIMPENYIAMFSVPDEKESKEIVLQAAPAIDTAVNCVRNGKKSEFVPNFSDIIKSSVVNSIFCRICVKDKKFRTADKCTGCGLCETLCPVNNIKMIKDRPVWQGNCTHCMACICRCPAEAIEYGNKSAGKPRYKCPEKLF